MRSNMYRDIKTDERVLELRINSMDLSCPLLTSWDRCLLQECEESDSLADKLLALETIVRRNEQHRESKEG